MITIRGLIVAQRPNRSLTTAMVATALGLAVREPRLARGADALAGTAMIVWGYQELFDGVNWFRRGLGAGGVGLGILRLRGQLAESGAQA